MLFVFGHTVPKFVIVGCEYVPLQSKYNRHLYVRTFGVLYIVMAQTPTVSVVFFVVDSIQRDDRRYLSKKSSSDC